MLLWSNSLNNSNSLRDSSAKHSPRRGVHYENIFLNTMFLQKTGDHDFCSLFPVNWHDFLGNIMDRFSVAFSRVWNAQFSLSSFERRLETPVYPFILPIATRTDHQKITRVLILESFILIDSPVNNVVF